MVELGVSARTVERIQEVLDAETHTSTGTRGRGGGSCQRRDAMHAALAEKLGRI
ncbi:hypothetical protein [Nonomuraea turcica]|uniref:hypothetical protein n=1 Tax=Nonomuraea sp. G32 TaxID=3067274 RepID=UPI00273B4436|nr:hypothetical protein [Nonomuraea sp. G32]MDP4504044.1 hypothetical protein [Nonomuraea sp. G32]